MATPHLAKKPCVKCQKGGGVATCDGCQQCFCTKHLVEHRQELSIQMDYIGQEYDSLRRDLTQPNLTHPLLLRINEWEQESIIKIQAAAETARADLQKLLHQTKSDVKTSVDKITDELQAHQESDDYTETDLSRWSTNLTNVRKLLEVPSTIQIVEDENISTVIHLIKVLEQNQLQLSIKFPRVPEKSLLPYKELVGSTQERFGEVMDYISVSEDGLVATYAAERPCSYRTVFGKNSYRSGVHDIHFRIENKDTDNMFFGIVTSSCRIRTAIFETPTASGWWGFDYPVVNGKRQNICGEKVLQTGDVVKLTLDCDKKRIQFENLRTKTIVHSFIDILKCPFPWKIAISLSRLHDSLRIL